MTHHEEASQDYELLVNISDDKEDLRLIFEHASIGMATTTPSGWILRVNRAFCKMLGYTSKELLKRTVADITHPDDLRRNHELFEQLLAGQIPNCRMEQRYIRKGGEPISVIVQAGLIQDTQGRSHQALTHVISIQQDVTPLKLGQRNIHTTKADSVGVLTAGLAQNFNNLLVAILGQISLAQAKLPTDGAARVHLDKALRAAEQEAELVEQMLTYAGLAHFHRQTLHLNDLIQDHLSCYETTFPANVRLRYLLHQSLPQIEGDPGQMQRVILNLVLNAIEAIGNRRGVVLVSTHVQTVAVDEDVRLFSGASLAAGQYVTLRVRDNGSGIQANNLARIFDPFFTTRFTGRGLGLAAVQGIVQTHQGGLQVFSREGKGAVFIVFLPVYSTKPNMDPNSEEGVA